MERLVKAGNSGLKGVLGPGGAVATDDNTVTFTLIGGNGNFPYLVSIYNAQTVITGVDRFTIHKRVPVDSILSVPLRPRHFRESRVRPPRGDRRSAGRMIFMRVRDDHVARTVGDACGDGVKMGRDANPRVDQHRLRAIEQVRPVTAAGHRAEIFGVQWNDQKKTLSRA